MKRAGPASAISQATNPVSGRTTVMESCAHLFVHMVWSTHHRRPLIVPSIRVDLYACLEDRGDRVKCRVLAVGGMPDHVHVAVRLHQTVSVSKLAQELKGGSSYEMGRVQRYASTRLAWQEGYGAFSFAENDLATVVRYIRTQPDRHARGGSLVREWEVPETTQTNPEGSPPFGPVHESPRSGL